MTKDETEKLDQLIARMDAVQAQVTTFIDIATPILEELKPTVDRIMSSPMMRMVFGGKK